MNYWMCLINHRSEFDPTEDTSLLLCMERLLQTITGEFSGIVKVNNDDGKTVLRNKITKEFVTMLRKNYRHLSLGYDETTSAVIVTTTASEDIVGDMILCLLHGIRVITLDATKLDIEYHSSETRGVYEDQYA